MRIWLDFDNSPHPLLFAPIASRLEERGHTVLVTARDNAQTVELTRERWPDATVIGGPAPKGGFAAKARAITNRANEMRRWAKTTEPDIALSHNSYAQIIAAKRLGIRAITAMDYEHHPANHLAFRLSNTVLLPAALDFPLLRRQGAAPRKTHFYPGLKEELYLADFAPDHGLAQRLGAELDGDRTLVVARPAPDLAIYHSFENPLFVECVKRVLRDPKTTVVVLLRHAEQRKVLQELGPRCIVPDHAVDSRSLMSQADLMIGAGGTMTREAALLGVPTVSLFAGRRPAVDIWLEERGLITALTDVDQLPAVEPQPRADRLADLKQRGGELVDYFCDATVAA